MQILRTKGIKSHGWGGYLNCRIHSPYLPTLEFRYMPKTSTKFLIFVTGYASAYRYKDMPIGMSTDACMQYWEDL